MSRLISVRTLSVVHTHDAAAFTGLSTSSQSSKVRGGENLFALLSPSRTRGVVRFVFSHLDSLKKNILVNKRNIFVNKKNIFVNKKNIFVNKKNYLLRRQERQSIARCR